MKELILTAWSGRSRGPFAPAAILAVCGPNVEGDVSVRQHVVDVADLNGVGRAYLPPGADATEPVAFADPDPPWGLWVWECEPVPADYPVHRVTARLGHGDLDIEMPATDYSAGAWRAPTDAEWAAIRASHPPWPPYWRERHQ